MSLLHVVYGLEKIYEIFNFNRKPFAADALLAFGEAIGLKFLVDRSVKTAVSFKYKSKYLVFYNPYYEYNQLTLMLGHEIGHYLLGHLDNSSLYYTPGSLFSYSGIEKDASIIGFLTWQPTTLIEKYAYIEPDTLYNQCSCCDSNDSAIYELCKARLRIYKAYKNKMAINYLDV